MRYVKLNVNSPVGNAVFWTSDFGVGVLKSVCPLEKQCMVGTIKNLNSGRMTICSIKKRKTFFTRTLFSKWIKKMDLHKCGWRGGSMSDETSL
jgi:hypothetical protein